MKRIPLLAALLPLLLVAGCDRPENPPHDAMEAPTPREPSEDPNVPADVAVPPQDNSPVDSADTYTAIDESAPQARQARLMLQPTQGHAATGELMLTAEPDGVRITGQLAGLDPNSTHGFHVHETGDCSAPDASSAGGHFNPAGAEHGDPTGATHHAGDMPNLSADAQGNVQVNVLLPGVTLGGGGDTDIANRALVLHAKADDYRTQPSGDSGARIACGVITLAE